MAMSPPNLLRPSRLIAMLATLLLAGCAISPRLTPEAELTGLPASYTGTLPCADCPGIDYHLDLFADHSYLLRRHYREADADDNVSMGRWHRDDQGQLVLRGGDEQLRYGVLDGGTALEQRARDGSAIASELDYSLRRTETFQPALPATLTLNGMYTYKADAAALRECVSGQRLPVSGGEANPTLQRAYRQAAAEPGAPVKVTVRARIEQRPAVDAAGAERAIRVAAVEGVWPGETCGTPLADASLINTRWRVTRLNGEPLQLAAGEQVPHIRLHEDQDNRVTGFTGCNRVIGTYERSDDHALHFPQLASTLMACPDTAGRERGIIEALEATSRYRIDGSHLMLRDEQGRTRLYLEATHL